MQSLRRVKRRAAGSGVAVIMIGTGLGQVTALAAAPLISRLYTPTDFGLFMVVSSVALTFSAVASLRLESAIVLPSSDDDARGLVRIACCVAVGLTLSIAGATWLFRGVVLGWFTAGITVWLLISSFGIGGAVAMFNALNQWVLRNRRYDLIARRNLLQALVTTLAQIVTGVAGYAHGLVAGMAVGQAAGAAAFMNGASLRYKGRAVKWGALLSRFRHFPMHLAPAALINAAGIYVPLILFAAYFGPAQAGLLGLTQRVLGLPMTLIGQAAAQIYLAELAAHQRTEPERGVALFAVASKRLAIVGAAVAAPVMLLGPWAFPFVFGKQWSASGEMAQAMAIALAAQLVASTLSRTLIVLEKTLTQLAWDVLRFAMNCGAVFLAALAGSSALLCVWLLAASTTVTYALSWELSRRAVRSRSGIS